MRTMMGCIAGHCRQSMESIATELSMTPSRMVGMRSLENESISVPFAKIWHVTL